MLITVFSTQIQYILGKMREPAGTMYLGTVHYPPDYFYYLSQMIQGKAHWLYSTMLFTSEKLPMVLVGWQHVLFGRVFSLLGIGVIDTYELAVISSLLLFLILAYFLVRIIFPDDKYKRILAYFFFVSANSLFKIINTPKGWDLSFFWYWYNHGFQQVRFGPTPHHLLANSFYTLILILAYYWFSGRRHRIKIALGLVTSSVILSSINPVYWGLATLILGVTPAVLMVVFKLKEIKGGLKGFKGGLKQYFASLRLESLLAPFVLLLISGFPVALYVKSIYVMPPYSYSNLWEAQQQVWVNPYWLVVGSGLVIPLAVIGVIGFLRAKNILRVMGVILILICSVFYMSPIPQKLGVTNIRFWSSNLYIFWGALAAEGVIGITNYELRIKNKRRISFLVFSLIMIVYLVSIIPTYYVGYRDALAPTKLNDSFYYLPKDAYSAYLEAAKLGDEKSIYLVQWPFDETFPALTGRKSFYGYYMLTINSSEKEQKAFSFLDGKMTDDEAKAFLNLYKINFIITYPWKPKINDYTFINRVGGNGFLGVYRVEL